MRIHVALQQAMILSTARREVQADRLRIGLNRLAQMVLAVVSNGLHHQMRLEKINAAHWRLMRLPSS